MVNSMECRKVPCINADAWRPCLHIATPVMVLVVIVVVVVGCRLVRGNALFVNPSVERAPHARRHAVEVHSDSPGGRPKTEF